MKKRLDKLIFDKGLAESREKAQKIIMAGLVFVDGKKVDKAGSQFDEDTNINISQIPQYVGRGAEKLKGAASAFKIDFENKVVADIGASTGGFTDFALQGGAKKVYAIDVGYGQLDWKLRNEKKVVVMERINARDLKSFSEKIDFFLVDVSFISARKILLSIKEISEESDIVLLFKPQFEAGKEIVDKTKGIIKDPEIHEKLLNNFKKWCAENDFNILGQVKSPILGDKGNKEFFFYISIINY